MLYKPNCPGPIAVSNDKLPRAELCQSETCHLRKRDGIIFSQLFEELLNLWRVEAQQSSLQPFPFLSLSLSLSQWKGSLLLTNFATRLSDLCHRGNDYWTFICFFRHAAGWVAHSGPCFKDFKGPSGFLALTSTTQTVFLCFAPKMALLGFFIDTSFHTISMCYHLMPRPGFKLRSESFNSLRDFNLGHSTVRTTAAWAMGFILKRFLVGAFSLKLQALGLSRKREYNRWLTWYSNYRIL